MNWSTPSAHDGRRPGSDETSTQGRNLKREAEALAHAQDADRGGQAVRATDGGGQHRKLEDQIEAEWQETDTTEGDPRTTPQPQRDEWQTPATDSFRSRGGDRRDEMGLDQQARLQWVTPASRDAKGPNSLTHCTETGGGRKHMDQLSNQVEHSFLPAPATAQPGPQSSQSARGSRRPSAKRKLNPIFTELLMNWPIGWTEM